jgi:hypothetical protein
MPETETLNGTAVETAAPVETIADVASHITDFAAKASAIQSMSEIAVPFSQREHDLMLEAVDHVAGDWVSQLRAERQATEALEQRVLERLGKLKNDLTQLFLLGNAVCGKVRRDQEFNEQLHAEIDKLAEEPV